MSRRQALGSIGAALAGGSAKGAEAKLRVAGQDVEIQLAPVSVHTVRLTVLPRKSGKTVPVKSDGTLVHESWGPPAVKVDRVAPGRVNLAHTTVTWTADPLEFRFKKSAGESNILIDRETGAVSFSTGGGPIFGMGEGGPQFDRHGNTDRMFSGSSGYNLRTFGSRVPVPWIIATSGWAMYIHQPFGRFDFTGEVGKFLPAAGAELPLDVFLVLSSDPATVMAEYARLTGFAELPALWTFGYQQSHRTLGSREEILNEAKMFREKKLPCDTLIYLGTGFCPSGWNTNNGEFAFNTKVMPDPKAMFDQLHQDHFKVVLHVAYPTGIHEMAGTVKDACDPQARAETQPSCYWDMHRPVLATGVDGWWPDEGDALNLPSRLVRNRMYWDASQIDHPDAPAVRAASQRGRGHAAVRSVSVVGRCQFAVGDAEESGADRHQQRAHGHALLGHGYRRLRADGGTDRRTVRALVPVRRLLHALPLAWAGVDAASSVGLESGRTGTDRCRTKRRCARRSPSITTRRWSRFAASIWSCAIA